MVDGDETSEGPALNYTDGFHVTLELQNYSTTNDCLYERIDFDHLDAHFMSLALSHENVNSVLPFCARFRAPATTSL